MLPTPPKRARPIVLAFAILLAGCRLEVRAPDAASAETENVETAVAAWYAAAAAQDTVAWERLVSPAATLLLPGAEPRLVPVRVILGIPGVRGPGPVRVVRAEARLDRGTALVRVTVARPAPDAAVEEETVDHVTLARMDATWRIAHVVAGSWRRRGGPS
jgi:hypothetical protein